MKDDRTMTPSSHDAEPHSAADRGLALLALRPLTVNVRRTGGSQVECIDC